MIQVSSRDEHTRTAVESATVETRLRRLPSRLRFTPMSHATGRYASFPRTAWICVGLSALFVFAALKLAIVDGAFDVAGYPLLGAIGFLAWPGIALLTRGTFVVTPQGVQGRRPLVGGFDIARGDILGIEPYGSKKMDTLGVVIRRRQGASIVLARIAPESRIGTLLDYGRGGDAVRAQPQGHEAFSDYARGGLRGGPMR